jgi:hypothetical protein
MFDSSSDKEIGWPSDCDLSDVQPPSDTNYEFI